VAEADFALIRKPNPECRTLAGRHQWLPRFVRGCRARLMAMAAPTVYAQQAFSNARWVNAANDANTSMPFGVYKSLCVVEAR
jgi:hypothetical protein